MMNERRLYRCDCGHYEYLDVYLYDEDEPGWETISFGFVSEPKNIWDRIKAFFQYRPNYWHEILLKPEQARELGKLLTQVEGDD